MMLPIPPLSHINFLLSQVLVYYIIIEEKCQDLFTKNSNFYKKIPSAFRLAFALCRRGKYYI